jgi:hypothetical protein
MQSSQTTIKVTERPVARSFKKQLTAMFFAGLARDQTITHWALGSSGELTITYSFYTLTPQINHAASVFWPVLAVALLIYCWPRELRQEPHA